MSISQSVARYLSAAAVACSLLAAAPAHAAVIASFDPAFGPSIPNLGFRGTMTLDVSSGCYALGSGYHATGGGCQITALSAQVDFYNTGHPATTLYSALLGGSYFAPTYVFGAYFDPLTGQLAGFDSDDSANFNVSVSDSPPPVSYGDDMVLFFRSGLLASFTTSAFSPSATVPGIGGAYLRSCTRGSSGCEGDTSNAGTLVFTTVPEPDSIALALLGVGALALTRRRRPPVAG